MKMIILMYYLPATSLHGSTSNMVHSSQPSSLSPIMIIIGKYDEAEALYKKSVELREKSLGKEVRVILPPPLNSETLISLSFHPMQHPSIARYLPILYDVKLSVTHILPT